MKDLFLRMNVMSIYMPPLRDRKEDIPLLVDNYMHQQRVKTGKNITGLTPEVMDLFMKYEWPKNSRELENALEYAFVIAQSGKIALNDLPAHFPVRREISYRNNAMENLSEENSSDEKTDLIEALRLSHGNKTAAANILGVHRMTVSNRMKKYGINLKRIVE